MKRPIKDFKAARSRLEEVADSVLDITDFLKMADDRIAAINMLKGETDVAKPRGIEKTEGNHQNGDVPESWTDRILQVFNAVKKTMKPQDVMAEYQKLKWPRPEKERDFYKQVYSTLYYLTNTKLSLLKDDDGGFRLKS